MRPTLALAALVLATSLGPDALADDPSRPVSVPPQSPGTSVVDPPHRGFLGRFRKPPRVEVPPSPPRTAPAGPKVAPPTLTPPPVETRPLPLAPAIAPSASNPLRAIPTGPRPAAPGRTTRSPRR